MKSLIVVAFALVLSAQTWNCITVSGGTPSIIPPQNLICNPGSTPLYFTQTATFQVVAYSAQLGANIWGPTPVSVNGSGACHEPAGDAAVYWPYFTPVVSSGGSTCTFYVRILSYVNSGGTIQPSLSTDGVRSNIPCGPCKCTTKDCSYGPARAQCGACCAGAMLKPRGVTVPYLDSIPF